MMKAQSMNNLINYLKLKQQNNFFFFILLNLIITPKKSEVMMNMAAFVSEDIPYDTALMVYFHNTNQQQKEFDNTSSSAL